MLTECTECLQIRLICLFVTTKLLVKSRDKNRNIMIVRSSNYSIIQKQHKHKHISDVTISSDVPIFATGKSRNVFVGRGNSIGSMEDHIMAARWIVSEFFHQISVEKQKSPNVISILPNWH